MSETAEEIFEQQNAASLARVRVVAAALCERWDDPVVATDLDELAERRRVKDTAS